MKRLLAYAFSNFVKRGSLKVITARGEQLVFGDGSLPRVRIRFADSAAERALLLDPEMKLGELFTDGRLVVEEGTLFDFLQLLLQDSHGERLTGWLKVLGAARDAVGRLSRANRPKRARRNIAHHYDLDGRLYSLFLDADRQYSCAYYERPDLTLDEAQRAKKRHIMAKLLVEPGQSVLDIGSGWGGLAMDLAEIAGAGRVLGITLSEEQLAYARAQAAERGLADRVAFALEDYRATTGRFDRIVSVGMFEHVGAAFYDAYFEACRRLLAEDGVVLLHTIGRTGVPGSTNPWITRYIFPGGYLPTLSEIMGAVERSGLVVTDVEVWRLHYALTLRAWRERFMARRDEARRLHDERFCRMWECYLTMSETAFRFEDVVVFQLQLARRNDTVPLTRDYIAERKRRLTAAQARR